MNVSKLRPFLSRRSVSHESATGSVVLDFAGTDGGRYITYLVAALEQSETFFSNPWCDPQLDLYVAVLGLRRVITSVRLLEDLRPVYPHAGLVVTDRSVIPTASTAILDRNYYTSAYKFGEEPSGSIRMPFYMHPEVYRAGLHRRLGAFRARPQNIGIFFAGTTGAVYADRFTFPLMTRKDIFEAMDPNVPLIPFSATSGRSLAGGQHVQEFVVSVTEDGRNVLNKHALTLDEYFGALAISAFALCPPGIEYPHSHNLIEAMAVGAVPITNYASYMSPPLTHGETCLQFSTAAELRSVVSMALWMPNAERLRMRSNVLSYYDTFLSPASFGPKLLQAARSGTRLLVNDSGNSIALRAAELNRGDSLGAQPN